MSTRSGDVLVTAASGYGLRPVFQPIVCIPDGHLVGYEALARWPSLGELNPAAVFAYALKTNQARALERQAIEASLVAALESNLAPGSALFINCEAGVPHVNRSAHSPLHAAAERFRLVFELTERSLASHLPEALRKIDAIRADGFAVALDDLGAQSSSLALLDLIAPDIIKLDLELVQSQPRYHQARMWAAVLAHHERAGAVILAEGIETDEHLRRALALGATLGQGYRFGTPQPLNDPAHQVQTWVPPIRLHHPTFDPVSPFEIVNAAVGIREERKDTVLALSRHLEQQALHAADAPMVLTALQSARFLTETTLNRYAELAHRCPVVAIFGRDIAPRPAAHIRGVSLADCDPINNQWIVLTLGATTAAALVAQEVPTGPTVRDCNRRFDVGITTHRDLVTLVAAALLSRLIRHHQRDEI